MRIKVFTFFILLAAGFINCQTITAQNNELASNSSVNIGYQASNLSESDYIWNDAMSISPITYETKETQAFCTPTVSGATTHYITTVTSSGGTTNINNPNNATSTTSTGYSDYTASYGITVVVGTSLTLNVTDNNSGTHYVYVWLSSDNGVTWGSNLCTLGSQGVTTSTTNAFVIPAGTNRMRVAVNFSSSSTSCIGGNVGEYEDYAVYSSPCSNIITIGGTGATYAQSFTAAAGTGTYTVPMCSGSNTYGIEKIYQFACTVTGTYTFQVTAVGGGYVSYAWKSGSCASTGWGAWRSVYSMTQNPITCCYSSNACWTAGTTYYIILKPEGTTGGSSYSQTFYINAPTVLGAPTSPTATPSVLCPGGSSSLSATATNGDQVYWYSGSCGGTYLGTNGVSVSSAGTYYAKTYNSTCSTLSSTCASVTITAGSNPATSASVSATTICTGGIVTLTGGPAGMSSYSWTGPAGCSYSPGNTSQSPTVTMASTGGTFTLTATNSNGCSAQATTSSVTVVADPSAPTATKSPNVATVCSGQTLTLTGVTDNGGGTGTCNIEYCYSTNSGGSYSSWSTTMPSYAAVAGYNNIIKIRKNCNGSGCDISSENSYSWSVVSDPSAPTATKSPTDATVCSGQTLTLTGVTDNGGGTGTCNIEYCYSTNSGGSYTSWSTTLSSFAAVAGYNNIIKIRKNCNGSGCDISSENSYSWSVVADPSAPTATKSPNFAAVCEGATLTLTSPTSGGGGTGTCNYEYQYSTDGSNYSSWSTSVPGFSAEVGTNYIRIRTNCNGTGCDISGYNAYSWTVNAIPAAPTVGTIIQPTCATATGTIPLTAPTSCTFSITGSGGTYQASPFTNVATGSYTVWTQSASGCISASGTSAVVNSQPPTPAAPTVGTITQPTCAIATGTIPLTAPASCTFSITGSGGTYQASPFTNVVTGTYTVWAQNASGCISATGTSAVINTQPVTPSVPSLSVTQPTCSVQSGTITVTAPTGAYTYNVDGGTYQSGTSFSGLPPGSHTVIVEDNSSTCTSSNSASVNTLPVIPSTPSLSVTQPSCSVQSGTITVTAPTGAYSYNVDGGAYQSGTSFSGLAPGSHTVIVEDNSSTCTSSNSASVNALPSIPSNPSLSITQPTCSVQSGTITVTAPTGAYTYNIDGGTFQSGTSFSGLAPGSHTVIVEDNSSTCTSSNSTSVNALPAVPATPSSPAASPLAICSGQSSTLSATVGSGETVEWFDSSCGVGVVSSPVSPVTTTTYYAQARNTTSGCVSAACTDIAVTVSPLLDTPAFMLGSTSSRCIGAGNVTYSATAANNTGLSYSLNPACIGGGNSINATTGEVTYSASWAGTTIITVTAQGCSGPKTADHTVTIVTAVGSPVFDLGTSSSICQGSVPVTYNATASGSTGISYSLDPLSITGGNSINTGTGEVTYDANWVGVTTITASAAGCSGPTTSKHVVTITPTVGKPVFAMGSASTRCQGSGSFVYSATSDHSTAISYSLDPASITGGNSINSTTGEVTFVAGWLTSTTITATATGCNGPATADHVVSSSPCTKTLHVTMFLEGFYKGSGKMNYTKNILFHSKWGGAIVDTICVELHDANVYSNIIYLARGIAIDTFGLAEINVPGTYNGNYYITVKHRNHLEVVSTVPVSFAGNSVNYDFRANITNTYGNNMKDLGDGNFAVYCGDITQAGTIYEYPNTPVQDGMIDLDDNYYVFSSYLHGDLGYFIADLNGDGMVDINDVYLAFDNYLLGVYLQTP